MTFYDRYHPKVLTQDRSHEWEPRERIRCPVERYIVGFQQRFRSRSRIASLWGYPSLKNAASSVAFYILSNSTHEKNCYVTYTCTTIIVAAAVAATLPPLITNGTKSLQLIPRVIPMSDSDSNSRAQARTRKVRKKVMLFAQRWVFRTSYHVSLEFDSRGSRRSVDQGSYNVECVSASATDIRCRCRHSSCSVLLSC